MADRLNNKLYEAWIAIDIAKDFNAVLSEAKEGKRQYFRMANSAADHDRFIAFLRSLSPPCIIGLESTGNYRQTFDHRLALAGFEVCFISR